MSTWIKNAEIGKNKEIKNITKKMKEGKKNKKLDPQQKGK